MDWLLITELATDGAALASTIIAMILGYRAFVVRIEEDASGADLRRQSDYAVYAAIASALAATSFGVALLSI